MCGICGVVGRPISPEQLEHANDLMRHRGPDGAGHFHDGDVALAMRRLSIIDIAGGTQPKQSEDGSIQVVFNGEIYNFRELRVQLVDRGHVFQSHSDTEVIVHAYEEWGEAAFKRLHGIFAIALWEVERRRLTLARDHLGVKPLYYSHDGSTLAFGSELKPLVALLPSVPHIDPVAVSLYLRYQYVPTPRSVFDGVCKLPPGHLLRFEPGTAPRVAAFWNPLELANDKGAVSSLREAEDLVDDMLRRAVQRQMISDVPLGAFLSGGVDSSTVVAMMQQVSNHTVKTFSIGFREAQVDESPYAQAVADHLGTEHHAWIITEEDALAVVPKLPYYFDEPFADSSAVPTYLVSELARRHVTVSLSGDGGDELFGGYDRYRRLGRVSPWWRVPQSIRAAGIPLLRRVPGQATRMLRRADAVLAAPDIASAYRSMILVTRDSLAAELRGESGSLSDSGWPLHLFSAHDPYEAMMLTDLITYLPDDILTKVDRASMAHSLEARVPILDVEFVERVLALPTETRLSRGPKTLLKDVLKRYIPAHLVDRKKQGFSMPLALWLRTGLREHLLDHLSDEALGQHALFHAPAVSRITQEHLSGQFDWSPALWAILMFQMWYSDISATFQTRPGCAVAPEA